jgi:DNA-binding NarL/FixJ family response regulator
MESKVRILLADNQALLREGLRKLLESERGLSVIGEASDGVEALRLTTELKPDVLLLEWALPRLAGVGVLRGLRGLGLSTRVIVLTAGIDSDDVQRAVEHGARGLVLKATGCRVLIRAIRGVMEGQYWFGRDTLAEQVQALRRVPSPGSLPKPRKAFGLTAREIDIVSAVAAAYPNKEIAQRFSISQKTVKHHLSNIFDKVGVSNRLELALFALSHRLELADMTTGT